MIICDQMEVPMQRKAEEIARLPGSSRVTSRWAAQLAPALLAVPMLSLSAGSASADCKEEPKPGVDWSDCQKTRLMIGGADLSGGIFNQTFFTSTDLREANLSGAELVRAEFSNANLAGADLSGANMEKAAATRADFSGADLSNANLASAEFSRSNFTRANVTGAEFNASEMNRSDFTEADLTGANMAKAELARVILIDAVVSGVSFGYSNLSRANLTGTDLEDADLTGTYMFLTRIDGADLSRTKGLTADQLEIACGSADTRLPEGLATPESWPCPDYSAE